MEKLTIWNTNSRNIRFTGELLAQSSETLGTGRGREFKLYKTKAGKYVAQKGEWTQWQGETNTYTAYVCENEEEVVQFLGLSDLAKEIYYSAEIDAYHDVV